MAHTPNDPRIVMTSASTAGPELQEIREQMDETRAALSDKLETLQRKAADQVEVAQSTLNQTVVTVERTFNLQHQISRHPWLALGASLAVGYWLGHIKEDAGVCSGAPALNGSGKNGKATASHPVHSASRRSSSGNGRLLHEFSEEIGALKKAAVQAGTVLLAEWLKHNLSAAAPEPAEKVNPRLVQRRSTARRRRGGKSSKRTSSRA